MFNKDYLQDLIPYLSITSLKSLRSVNKYLYHIISESSRYKNYIKELSRDIFKQLILIDPNDYINYYIQDPQDLPIKSSLLLYLRHLKLNLKDGDLIIGPFSNIQIRPIQSPIAEFFYFQGKLLDPIRNHDIPPEIHEILDTPVYWREKSGIVMYNYIDQYKHPFQMDNFGSLYTVRNDIRYDYRYPCLYFTYPKN